jgi:acetoacetyl-CoA synthetase
MVVDLEYLGRESYMPLFVVLRDGPWSLDAMRERLNQWMPSKPLSPRFVPNEIFQVEAIPRTLSGKKQELPIKKLLLGQPLEKVVNREAMANPGCLDWYVGCPPPGRPLGTRCVAMAPACRGGSGQSG